MRAAFGEPYAVGNHTVIPVARVRRFVGLGRGRGNAQEWPKAGDFAKPVAVVSVGPGGAQVHEIADRTSLALASLVLIGLAMLLLWGYARRKGAHGSP